MTQLFADSFTGQHEIVGREQKLALCELKRVDAEAFVNFILLSVALFRPF